MGRSVSPGPMIWSTFRAMTRPIATPIAANHSVPICLREVSMSDPRVGLDLILASNPQVHRKETENGAEDDPPGLATRRGVLGGDVLPAVGTLLGFVEDGFLAV